MTIGVMQMIDSLAVGGAERVAVNLANLLPQDRYRSYLCSTRAGGPLADLIEPHVTRVHAGRTGRFDPGSILRIRDYLRGNDIRLIHAHGSSVFFARMVSAIASDCSVVWHDHYGRCHFDDRPAWLYRAATRGAGAVITVNQQLALWAQSVLHLPAERVFYIPNLVSTCGQAAPAHGLPGTKGYRIACVANLRPQKDHPNLLQAMQAVTASVPEAHLLLIGAAGDTAYRDQILELSRELRLEGNVTWLGVRGDVPAILAASDIGVLGSASEGLPLSLLEYGAARLAAVATDVGQCAEVLDQGRAGRLVPPSDPEALGSALINLLQQPELRRQFGASLHRHICDAYSPESVIRRICGVYDTALESL